MKTLITTILLFLTIYQAGAYWEQLNKPPHGVVSIQCFEEHNGVLFAGSLKNNLYKYDTISDRWILKNLGLPPDIPEIKKLYSYKGILFATSRLGVFASTDNGDSWIERNNGFEKLLINEIVSIGDILVAGGAGTLYQNVYISSDLGATWELRVNKGLPPAESILSMAVLNDKIYIGTHSGLFYSDDLGDTWNEKTFAFPLLSKSVRTLAINDNNIYIGTDDALYISVGGGNAMNQTPGGGQKFISSISFENRNVIVTTWGSGVYHSDNEGASWREVNSGIPPVITRSSIIFDGITIISPMQLGAYKSTDYGTNWEVMNNGFADFPLVGVLLADNELFVSTMYQGIAHTSNNGITWNFLNEGLEHFDLLRVILCNNRMFASQDRGKNSYYKNNNETRWNQIESDNLPDGFIFGQIFCFKNEVYSVGSNGIYKLNQNDNKWMNFVSNGNWNQIVKDEKGLYIYSKWLESIGDYLIVGTNHGIMVYDDLKDTWSYFSNEFLYYDIRYFSKSGEHIYVLYDKLSENGDIEKADQILIFDINQSNWQHLDVSFDLSVRGINVINGFLFVSFTNFSKILYTNDLGETWIDVSLPANISFTSRFQHNDEFVYIGTNDGVWRAKLSDFGIDVSVKENEIENRNYLYTYPPYPMPARSEVRAKIYFDSSTEISVENMAVYDIYGRKLPTKESLRLEQETFYSGYVIWDCAGVEPGVYIIRINHGTEVRAVKVMVGI